MTRERLELPHTPATREDIAAYRRGVLTGVMESATPNVVGSLIVALEQAWIERDVNAMELEATISERDEALKEGLALTIEKDEMQTLIDDLRKGHDRYETARRLSPAQWSDVWKLNISTGKPFDEIIDDLRPFVRPIHDSD